MTLLINLWLILLQSLKDFLNITLCIIIPTYLSFLEPASFNESPNYQLLQFSGHGFILIVFACSVVNDYSRNSVMRVTVLSQMKDDLLLLKERFLALTSHVM